VNDKIKAAQVNLNATLQCGTKKDKLAASERLRQAIKESMSESVGRSVVVGKKCS